MDHWLLSARFYDCLSSVAGGGRPFRDCEFVAVICLLFWLVSFGINVF